ncbi:MAG: hypothetical protein K2Z81_23280 [Cyanobacteria bacterium]|nr:hypothetical protein [Cyanobacteriota bacterium]
MKNILSIAELTIDRLFKREVRLPLANELRGMELVSERAKIGSASQRTNSWLTGKIQCVNSGNCDLRQAQIAVLIT